MALYHLSFAVALLLFNVLALLAVASPRPEGVEPSYIVLSLLRG